MATLATGVYTLAEMAGLLDPNFGPAQVINMLSQMNPLVGRMPMKQTNLPTGHQQTLQVTLPGITVKAVNTGVAPTKGTTTKTIDPLSILEAWCEVDQDAIVPGDNVKAVRAELAQTYIEAMAQKAAQLYVYGNSAVTAGEPLGLTPRYNSLTTTSSTYPNWTNIIDGGGTGTDNSSIWVLGLGAGKITGLYPMGGTAGLTHEDYDLQTSQVTAGIGGGGTLARVYRERFQWKMGLAVGDWRYAARLANVDISALVAETGTGNVDIIKNLIKLISRMPILDSTTDIVVTMNRTCLEMLAIQGRTASGGPLFASNAFTTTGHMQQGQTDGQPFTKFWGRDVLVTDQLTQAETRVV